jgi:Ca-activated chloride channel homolog
MNPKNVMMMVCASLLMVAGTLNAQFALTSESWDKAEVARTGRPAPPVNSIYQVSELSVHASIHNQVATVDVSQTLRNVAGREVEVELMFPLPATGGVQNFVLMVDGKEVPGKVLAKEEARSIYEGIVRRKQDPALMEYAGYGLYKTSVFPVPAGGTRTITLRYTVMCSRKQGNVQFVYPFGTQKFSNDPIGTIKFTATITSEQDVRNVFSPTHTITIDNRQSKRVGVNWTDYNTIPQQDFKLYFTPSDEEVSVTMMSYMRPEETSGSFLMLINPSIKQQQGSKAPKDIILTLDKSGSMSGQKIEQAKNAAEFILNNLNEGDRFTMVVYESTLSCYSASLLSASRENIRDALNYVRSITSSGGTNINEALIKALSYTSDGSRPQYILFLTDGMPTVGITDENIIAKNARSANKFNTRIHTFGVGYDVNARLLDRISEMNDGSVTYIKPGDNLEVAVSEFYKSIQTPVLTDISVTFSTGQVNEVYPVKIPDLFEGSRIDIAGRYSKAGKGTIMLKGKSFGETRTFVYDVTFSPKGENPEYAHIETIWATRKIGYLIDQIDLHGQNPELVASLTDLSKRYGIITPYTSFLAREDVNLYDTQINVQQTSQQLMQLEEVSGNAAVNQRASKSVMKLSSKAVAAGKAEYEDADGRKKDVESVKNVGNTAFYYKENKWVDGTLTEAEVKNATTVKQFSESWFELSRNNNAEMNQLMTFDSEVVVRVNGQVYRIQK